MSSRNKNTPENNRRNREISRRPGVAENQAQHSAGSRISSVNTANYTERTLKNAGRKKMDRRIRLSLLRSLIFI